jgi:hypothetical protein
MRRTTLAILVLAGMMRAQQVVAPTPEPVGPPRGEDAGAYNVRNSFETGYRFRLVDGNLGKYRSDVNYGNGVRLLGSNLLVNSRDGHGRFFDEILLNTLGLGNDPYQASTLRIQKNRLYRYDMNWRLNEYYNPGLPLAAGQHLMDTRRRLQDHDITLLPQSRVRLLAGYSRNTQSGPALSTIQLFDSRGDEFPLFTDVRREANEYRLGTEVEAAGVKLTLLHRWSYFKEDSPFALEGGAGNNREDGTALTGFRRAEPTRGRYPGWLVNLHADRSLWAANARFTYTGGRGRFIFDETAIGTNRFGAAQNRQIVVAGDARRPVSAGDLSLSFFPAASVTVVNNTSFHHTRIDGDASFREFENATQADALLHFRFLGIRAITNTTDLHYRAAGWLGFRAGYHFSTRRIRTVDGFTFAGAGDREAFEQNNRLHSGIAGVRLQPVKAFTVNLESEIGRADRPFTPISDRNFHALGARAQYKVRNLLLGASYRQKYNINSVTLSSFSSRARNYSAHATLTPRGWLALDASYMKLHLDTAGGIAFFAGFPRSELIEGRQSVYASNIHAGNLGAHFNVTRKIDLYLGYSITRDTGDGRSAAPAEAIAGVFAAVRTFPLTYHSPLGRVSVRLHSKLRWNAGWQFYRYREEMGLFSLFQNYRAHTGYTSLLWSF